MVVYDPKVSAEEIMADVVGKDRPEPRLTVATSAYDAAAGAHAIAIVTEWDEFRTLDFGRILASMHQPAFLFDGRNITDLAKLRALGFRASGIGK